MKKKLLLVLMLIAAVVVMPRVYADEAKTITLGEVTDITNEDTLKSGDKTTKSLVSNDDHSVVTITYDAAEFKLLDNGSSENVQNRPAGYAWIGFQVKKATNATKYSVKFNDKETDIKEQTLSGDSFDDYIGFKKEDLEAATKAGKKLEYTYEITWVGEDETTTATQTIKVVVNPAGTVLEAQDKEEDVWNNETYEAARPAKVTVKVMKDGKEFYGTNETGKATEKICEIIKQFELKEKI